MSDRRGTCLGERVVSLQAGDRGAFAGRGRLGGRLAALGSGQSVQQHRQPLLQRVQCVVVRVRLPAERHDIRQSTAASHRR